MAKPQDKIYYCDAEGHKRLAVVTRGETIVDGLPVPGSYDADTVDLSVLAGNEDGTGVTHFTIEGGVVGAKRAKTQDDQKSPGHWWPRS